MLYRVRRSAEGVYYLYEHRPVSHRIHYRGLVSGDTRAINFKLFGQDAAGIRVVVDKLRSALGCAASVGVPSSAPGRGRTGDVAGKALEFVPTAARCRRHRGKAGVGITADGERARCRVAGEVQGAVLLVDDLYTTGRTMRVYSDILRSLGASRVERFAVGHREPADGSVAFEIEVGDSEIPGFVEAREAASFPEEFVFPVDAATAEGQLAASAPLFVARLAAAVGDVLGSFQQSVESPLKRGRRWTI